MATLLNIKHDKVTQELSKRDYDSKFSWQRVKPYVQELTQSKDTITLTFDVKAGYLTTFLRNVRY
jgi:hypothetical protein